MSISLREIVIEEIKPYTASDQPNITLSGPEVPLGPTGALAIGMAIHELATNAVKYGALSVPEGRINITWRFDQSGDTEDLVLDWVETNGPPVRAPARRGFGTTLIERGFAHELSGRSKLTFDPNGVRANLRAPVRVAAYGGHLAPKEQGRVPPA